MGLKWENSDSNTSGSDLQSVLAALAVFPCADDVGIEPCPEGPRQFSRLHAPMRGTIQAENCGPDPQTLSRPRDLAGRPYPGRLILLRDINQNRTGINIVLQTKPKTNIGYDVSVWTAGFEPACSDFQGRLDKPDSYTSRKVVGNKLLECCFPSEVTLTNGTTKNKKASDFSEAICNKIDFLFMYAQYSLGLLRGTNSNCMVNN